MCFVYKVSVFLIGAKTWVNAIIVGCGIAMIGALVVVVGCVIL